MRLSIRYDNKFETIEVSEEEMWLTLSLEGNEELTDLQKVRLIQKTFDEQFNRPEYNNWHKLNRHSAATTPPKKLNGRDGYTKVVDDYESKEKRKNTIELYPDNSDEVNREKQEEYEYACNIISKTLKKKQAELLITIVLDGVSVTEYAKHEGVSVSAISHRMETAIKNFKKVFPESSTFPSFHG